MAIDASFLPKPLANTVKLLAAAGVIAYGGWWAGERFDAISRKVDNLNATFKYSQLEQDSRLNSNISEIAWRVQNLEKLQNLETRSSLILKPRDAAP